MNLFRQLYLWVLGRDPQRLSRVVLLTFAVATCATSPANAGLKLKGDAELLKLTAMAHENNRERIHTWQGSAQVEVTYEDANGLMLEQKVSAPFLFDNKQDAIRWKWIPQQHLVRKQGQLVSANQERLETVNAMTKGDAFYHYAPRFTERDGERSSALVIWPRARARKFSETDCIHPMWYQTGHMTKCTDDLSERLMYLYRKANSRGFSSNVTVTRDGDVMILELQSEVVLNHFEFDLSKGGNIVKYYGKGKTATEHREWTYEEKNGIWVVNTFALDIQYNSPQSLGITQRFRKVTFVDNTLNRPIPPSEFSLEKLGVKVGDPVTDRIRGLSYLYRGTANLSLEDTDVLLKEGPVVKDKPSIQGAMETEEKQLTDEQGISDNVIAKQTTVGQVTQTERPGYMKYFIVGLVAILAVGLVSFLLLRKGQKTGAKA